MGSKKQLRTVTCRAKTYFEYYSEAVSLTSIAFLRIFSQDVSSWILILLSCSLLPRNVSSQTLNVTNCRLTCPNARLVACKPHAHPNLINLGVSDREVCHRHKDCYGGSSEQLVPVQQRPISILLGQSVTLRLDQSLTSVSSRYWQLYNVSSTQFLNCDIPRNSSKLIANITHSGTTVLNSTRYGAGVFYLAGEANNFLTCSLGLRIRISVKVPHCPTIGDSVCSGAGICIAGANETAAKCACCPGYNGTGCGEYDACSSSPCLNAGNCSDVVAGLKRNFTCSCSPHFTGRRCESRVDYCDPMPCLNNATCSNLILQKNYSCNCRPGYTGRNCEVNIDDCIINNCTNNATCLDLVNGYRCNCNGNWTGNFCQIDVNECRAVPCRNNATCVNTPGSFSCLCPVNVTGPLCETDLYNDCASDPCLHGGVCTDLVGGYSCRCSSGYTGPRCQSDVNECLSNPCSASGSSGCINSPGNFSCVCRSEYTGRLCENLVNRCIPSPCQHGGLCVNNFGGYTCVCPAGYQGKNCEDILNKCHYKPCRNNATCEQTGDFLSNYTCHCLAGWTGRNCTDDYNECLSTPCLNGGRCINKFNSYECVCPIGWHGSQCQVNYNACQARPCKNNATCTDLPTALDYSCTCAAGFTGKNCSTNIDDCVRLSASCNNGVCVDQVGTFYCNCSRGWYGKRCDTNRDMCGSRPCLNDAVCENVNTTLGYDCPCKIGWTGINCETNINDCASNPCRNGARCNDYLNYYNCSCLPGYTGVHCEGKIDECLSLPCRNNATCVNEIGRFACNCLPGYTGLRCETNINECASNPCFYNATCIDQVNAYTCRCQGGYLGLHCEIPKCRTNPCRNGATCIQRPDRYTCQCLPGYTGLDCDVDINECSSNPCRNNATCVDQINRYQCNCANGFTGATCETHLCDTNVCQNGASCHRTPSGYSCACRQGFTGQTCGQDINECLSSPCSENGTLNCTDLVGGYRCYCREGFRGSRCENHTCDVVRPCRNGATCLRSPHGYRCICRAGFTGTECQVDINECASSPCLRGTCTDAVNGYVCNCPSMFTGVRCETNMDSCASGPCLNNASCINNITSLSYVCSCLGGYTGQRCENHLCDAVAPCRNNATCLKLPGNYSCLCPNGFTGRQCESDINECSSSPCLNKGSCVDLQGSFACICPRNFTGRLCETVIDYCSPNPCNNGTCANNFTAGTYKCSCPPAFSGEQCQNHLCDSQNPCKNGATCVRALDRPRCICRPGFTGPNCSMNINECASNPCLNNGTCTDLVNGFLCTCDSQFTGALCETALDYCTPNPCRNSGSCQNDFGSSTYRCICQPNTSGRNCETVLGPCFSNPCLNNGNCNELPDGTFNCSCPFGFNGTTCEGITCPCQNGGRCATFNGTVKCICPNSYGGYVCQDFYGDCRNNESRKCIDNAFCVLGPYGYACQCPGHLSGDARCRTLPTCSPSPCQNNATCTMPTFLSLQCQCPVGNAGQFCQFDVNECASNPCLNGGHCREVGLGSFMCYCQQGFFGTRCQNRSSTPSSMLSTAYGSTLHLPVATSVLSDSKRSFFTATFLTASEAAVTTSFDVTRTRSSYLSQSFLIPSSVIGTRSEMTPSASRTVSTSLPNSMDATSGTSLTSVRASRIVVQGSSTVATFESPSPAGSVARYSSVFSTPSTLQVSSYLTRYREQTSIQVSSAISSAAILSLSPSATISSLSTGATLQGTSSSIVTVSRLSSAVAVPTMSSIAAVPSLSSKAAMSRMSSIAAVSRMSSIAAVSSLSSEVAELSISSVASSFFVPSLKSSVEITSVLRPLSSVLTSFDTPIQTSSSAVSLAVITTTHLSTSVDGIIRLVSSSFKVSRTPDSSIQALPPSSNSYGLSSISSFVRSSTITPLASSQHILQSTSPAGSTTASASSLPLDRSTTPLSVSTSYDFVTSHMSALSLVSQAPPQRTSYQASIRDSVSPLFPSSIQRQSTIQPWSTLATANSTPAFGHSSSAMTNMSLFDSSVSQPQPSFTPSTSVSSGQHSTQQPWTISSSSGFGSSSSGFASSSSGFASSSSGFASSSSGFGSSSSGFASSSSGFASSSSGFESSLSGFASSSRFLPETQSRSVNVTDSGYSLLPTRSQSASGSAAPRSVQSPVLASSQEIHQTPTSTMELTGQASLSPTWSAIAGSISQTVAGARSATRSTFTIQASGAWQSSVIATMTATREPCSPNPCRQGGNCTSGSSNNYNCSCPLGYGGLSCESLVCQCQNNGRCVKDSMASSFKCICKVGFSGNLCQNRVPDCRTANCSGRGVCTERLSGFVCECTGGYYGEKCQNYSTNCVPNPCQNSGICRSGTGGGFACNCRPGFQGKQCQFDYNECASNPCLNGGTCREEALNTYTCYCQSWSFGRNCEFQRSSAIPPSSAASVASYWTSGFASSLISSLSGQSTVVNFSTLVSSILPASRPGTTATGLPTTTLQRASVPSSLLSFAGVSPLTVHSSRTVRPTVSDTMGRTVLSTWSIISSETSTVPILTLTETVIRSVTPSTTLMPTYQTIIITLKDSSARSLTRKPTLVITSPSQSSANGRASTNVLHSTSFYLTPSTSIFSITSSALKPSPFLSPSLLTASASLEATASSISNSRSTAIDASTISPSLVMSSPTSISLSAVSPSPPQSSARVMMSSVAPTTPPPRNITCADSPCNGYPCFGGVNNGNLFRCQCGYPSYGPRCIEGITIHFPYFNGHSFVEYAPIGFNEVVNTIVMTFRTTRSNGLLLYAGHQTFRDFLMIRVVNGVVEFRFDAGAGVVFVTSPTRVDNGNLVTIRASHDSRFGSGSLAVNSSVPVTRSSTATFKSIQLSTPWFLGGIRGTLRPVNSSAGVPAVSNLIGCIRDLQVNSKPYRVVDAMNWSSISECDTPACQRGPCHNNATCIQNQDNLQRYTCQCGVGYFGTDCTERVAHCHGDPCNGGTCVWTPTGRICLCQFGRHGPSCLSSMNITNPLFSQVYNYSSYIQYPWQQTMRSADERFEIQLQFKVNRNDPNSYENGLLVYAGQSPIGASGDDFFAVGLINNYTYLIYNLGSGVATARSRQSIDTSRTWHSVVAGRNGRSGYLYTDNQPPTHVTSPGLLTGLDAYTPLFIGGVPDFSKLPSILRAYFQLGFVGTISDAYFRTTRSNLTALRTNATGNATAGGVAVERGLNIGDDSVSECVPNPCQNNGTCSQSGGQFVCHCPAGWSGVLCNYRRIPCVDYNPCAAGAVCQSNANGISCDCQLGRIGTYCHQSINITQPFFKANSFMAFRSPDVKYFTKLQLRFKAAKLNGLLFYISENMDSSSGDFFAISLWNGYVYVRFNLGLGLATMRSRNTIRIGQWHELYVERRRKEAIMRLDSNMYIGVRGPGSYTQLNVASVMYLGGLPRLSTMIIQAVKDVNSQRDFEGTVSRFIVNNVLNAFNSTKVGRNIEDAQRTCVLNECKNNAVCTTAKVSPPLPYACRCSLSWEGALCDLAIPRYTKARFEGDGYIFVQDNITTPSTSNQIEFSLNTTSDGLILWLGELGTSKTDFMVVGIKNNKLSLVINAGSGQFQFNDNNNIADGQPHKVIITRVSHGFFASIAIIINGFAPTFRTTTSQVLNTAGHIYIGGLEGDIASLSKGQYRSGLTGCIWDVRVENILDLNKNPFNRGMNVRACS